MLFEYFPRLERILPRTRLTELPTPVEHAGRLGRALGVPGLLLKRDDLTSSSYGGSKPRKLEFLLGDALAQQHRSVVTSGSMGSHHAVATAIHGRTLGLRTELLLLPEPPSPHVSDNLVTSHCHGAKLTYVPTARHLASELRRAVDGGAYPLPPGGSSALGNLGYVNAALELSKQVERGEIPEPERLYLPMGTMGCAVGLCVGLKLTPLKTRLVAVRASNPSTSSREQFQAQFDQTVALLRRLEPSCPELRLQDGDVTLDGGHLGRGYALPTAEGRRALRNVQTHSSLQLELTYTAKTFAALLSDAPAFGSGSVLFWHTHGASLPRCGPAERSVPREFRGYIKAMQHSSAQ